MDSTQVTFRHDIQGRAARFVAWILPGALLAIIPKCPMCLAAYIAMISGVALPFPVASSLRMTLIGLCVASLSYVAFRKVRSYLAIASIRCLRKNAS